MCWSFSAAMLAAACVLAPERALAQEPISLAAALGAARSAPSVAIARTRVEEAEARLAAAQTRLAENPRVDAMAGPGSGGFNLNVGAEQQFDAPGSRAARISMARAALAYEQTQAEQAIRDVVLSVARAYVDALRYDRSLVTLESARATAEEIARASQRRFELGDIPVLDVNVVKAAAARAAADVRAATAARTSALAELSALLGVRVTAVSGTLDLPPVPAAGTLEAALESRPDLRALAAARDEALAEVRLGESQKRLRFGGLAEYERDGGDHKAIGGISIVFPAFNSGKDLRLPAAARARRLELEITSLRTSLRARIEGASAAAAQRREAVEFLLRDALPHLEENERLARRSYEAGQISLSEWLTLRRELLETRHDYFARVAEAILARIELDAMIGVLR